MKKGFKMYGMLCCVYQSTCEDKTQL